VCRKSASVILCATSVWTPVNVDDVFLQYFDVELLVGGTKQEAKKKLLEETRVEALEAAIAKVSVQIQLEKEEEEERKNVLSSLTYAFRKSVLELRFRLSNVC
jgi:hypothetical protein